MIIEFDCGNTRIKWRIVDEFVVQDRGAFATESWLAEINQLHASQLKGLSLKGLSITRVLVASVLGEGFRKQFSLWVAEHLSVSAEFAISEPHAFGITNGYQEPEKLGVDRWLAVIAARKRCSGGGIVVDCGSAVTVDLFTQDGEHLGGYIAPGLQLMRRALGNGTIQIKLGLIGYPDTVFPGRHTIAAIKSAELAMLNGLVTAAKACLSAYEQQPPSIIVTGGDGSWFSEQVDGHYVEDLVFEGLEHSMGLTNLNKEPL